MGNERGENKKRSNRVLSSDSECQEEKRARREAPLLTSSPSSSSLTPTQTTTTNNSVFHFPDLELEGKWYLNFQLPKQQPLKARRLSKNKKTKRSSKQLPKRFEVTSSDYFLPIIRQQLQRLCQPPLRNLQTKSSLYTVYRQACNETCRCHESTNGAFPNLEQASEQARAFFSQLPPDVASQLVVMITQFSNRAPPGSRVVLVVRPLPLDPQNSGRRKYQLQLRYVREGEIIEPATRMDSTKSDDETTSEGLNTSLPDDNLQSSLSASDLDIILSEKYFLWTQNEIELFVARQYKAPLQVVKQHMSKHSNSWPHNTIQQTVSDVFSFLESTPAPKWHSLQLAIHRIELMRYLRQLSTALSAESTAPIKEEDINQRWALFLLVDQKVKTFVATFGDEKHGCSAAVSYLTHSLRARWEQTATSLTPLQTYLRISEPTPTTSLSPSSSPSIGPSSAISSPCILPSPNPPC